MKRTMTAACMLVVALTNHTQSENFRINRARDCTFDNISCHDGMGIGFYVEKAAQRNGIYSNHHLTGDRFVNNTSTRNGKFNYCMVNRKSPKAEDNQDINGYGHVIENNIAYGTDRSLQWVNGDVDSCTVRNNSFAWNKETKKWDNGGLKKDMFDSIDPEVLLGVRDHDGMLTDACMAFMRLKRYEGRGADFSGYRAAVADMKKKVGAER